MNTEQSTLIIIRHGESEWNALGKWTGHTDVHLTSKGFHEAALMGELLADIPIHHAYISQQMRTKETLEGVLDGSRQYDVQFDVAPAINERDYGDYTGKNKWEMKEVVGEKAFHAIRRGWDVHIPNGESLKMVYERVVPFYIDTIVPRVIAGENILLVAHGNSIRSLVKYIESIPDDGIGNVEMIFGTALLYKIDTLGKKHGKDIRNIDTVAPAA